MFGTTYTLIGYKLIQLEDVVKVRRFVLRNSIADSKDLHYVHFGIYKIYLAADQT